MKKIKQTGSNDLLRHARTPVGYWLCSSLAVLAAAKLGCSAAQTEGAATGTPVASGTAGALAEPPDASWSFSASAYVYIVPESREYVQPTFAADREWLHLEARYNYEDLETGSAWVGYNVGGGEKLAWELTPMLGAVFGNTTGMAPGYKGSLSWWNLELYSEGEYVWDPADSSASYFYNWSELSFWAVDWFRIGMVTQRTRAYDSDREIQRGILAGVAYKRVDFTAYLFNPDDSEPILALALGVTF